MKRKKRRYEFVGGFVFLKRGDKREREYDEIREKTGVSPDETWSLYTAIAKFLIPRLKMFRECTCGYPACLRGGMKEWMNILKKMEKAFRLIAKDKITYSVEEDKSIELGLDLFRRYFQSLWW